MFNIIVIGVEKGAEYFAKKVLEVTFFYLSKMEIICDLFFRALFFTNLVVYTY